MATKEDGLYLKQHNSILVESHSDKSKQFSNLNLNQNRKCWDIASSSSVQAFSKSNSNKNSDYTVTENAETRNKSAKNLNLKALNNPISIVESSKEDVQKRCNPWMNEKKDGTKNKNSSSTLSLHIAAYEDSIEADSNKSEDLSTSKPVQRLIKLQTKDDLFEFPRQMEDSESSLPEIQQFSASQRLFTPNQGNNRMSLEPLRDLLHTFLRNSPIDENVVSTCVDVNFVGRLEGAEFDFTGVEDVWEAVIDELVKVVIAENGEDIIVQIENGEFSLKSVITVLGFAMERISDKTVQSSITALLAARIYLLLCCLTSAHVFGIYHFSLFSRAVASYRNVYTIKQLRGDAYSTTSKSKKKAQPKNKTAGTTTILGTTTAANASQFPTEIEDDASPQLLKAMSNLLLHSLEQIYVYLQQDTIGTNNKIFSSLIDLIRSICRFDYSSTTRTSPIESLQQFKKLDKFSDRCFALAHEAMKEKHNHEDMVLAMFCLPRLTFKSFESKFMKGSLPQTTIQMAEVMAKFVKERFGTGDEPYCFEINGKIVYSYQNGDELVTCNIGTDEENRDLIYVKRLAENICHQCLAERKDYRENSLRIAINFVKFLPPKLIQQFFYFAVNYGYLNNQRSRLIAVDLVAMLLETFDVASFPSGVPVLEEVDYEFGAIAEAVEYDDTNFHQNNPTFKKNWERFLYFSGDDTFQPRNAMLQLLVRATMDKLAAVRIRGLCAILPFIKDAEGYEEITKQTKEFVAHSRNEVVKVLSEVRKHDENIDRNTPTISQGSSQGTTNRPETPVPSHVHQAAQNAAEYLTNVSSAPFADLMIMRCNDKAPSVRKWVVPIVEALLNVETNAGYQKILLQRLQDFCRDPTVTVRKDGAQAMTAIVRDEEIFKQAWLHTVLPMVNDREESVEKSCREYFFNKIVQPIIRDDGSDSLSWNLMIEIAKTSEFTRAFRRCFQQTAREKEYNRTLRQLATVLYGAVKVDSVAASAWMLLDYLADAIEIDPSCAIVAWMNSDETSKEVDPSVRIVTNPNELVSILSIILKRNKALSEEQRDMIRDNIASRFVFLRLHETVISEAVITFVGIVSFEANAQDIANLHQFFAEVILKFYTEIRNVTEEDLEFSTEERKRRICLRLLTMGQLALHSPKSVSTEMIQLMTHILSVEAPSLDENTSKMLSRPVTRTGGPISQDPSELSQIQSLPFNEISGNISAAAVIAMGKFLLSNDDLVRDFLEKIAVVHGSSIHSAVRNNVIYVLADCYLRYTNKMDAIQPAFLHGLRDRVDFVRYHCLIRTTELLRSQYMKMSPLVLARLLPLYLDRESAIKDALTGETLAVIEDQFPNVYVDNFVTCMFLFNKVGFGAYKDIERYEMPENPVCFLDHDFSGALKRTQRMALYKFMLKKFDDQKRFTLINQISKTIFGNVVEGKISFETPEAKQLILDGFQVIECPEARLTLEEGQQDADEDAEAEVAPENVQSLARATIRATFCSAFVHYIMPQLMSMARFLAQKKSPLQKEFRNCLAVIAEAYPDQLHVLFRDSVQFKTEIEAELRRRKKDARKSRMAKNLDLVNNIERAAEAQAQRDAVESGDKENAPPSSPSIPTVKEEVIEDAQVQQAGPMEHEEEGEELMVVDHPGSPMQQEQQQQSPQMMPEVKEEIIEDAPMPQPAPLEHETDEVVEEEIQEQTTLVQPQPESSPLRQQQSSNHQPESPMQQEQQQSSPIQPNPKEDFEDEEQSTFIHQQEEPVVEQPKSPLQQRSDSPMERSQSSQIQQQQSSMQQQPQSSPMQQQKSSQRSSPMQQSQQGSPMQQPQSSPMLISPPRKHPSTGGDDIVPETPETPKQPTPKRARLSINRLQAIRDEEVAQNLALLRSPTLNAPVPKLSAKVGATQKKPTAATSSEAPEQHGRLHSTPVKTDMTLNFTFGLANISAIEQTSPRSRSSNVTFRRRKTSSKGTR